MPIEASSEPFDHDDPPTKAGIDFDDLAQAGTGAGVDAGTKGFTGLDDDDDLADAGKGAGTDFDDDLDGDIGAGGDDLGRDFGADDDAFGTKIGDLDDDALGGDDDVDDPDDVKQFGHGHDHDDVDFDL